MSQASVVLTIDKNHLRDLFLSLEKDRAAIEHLYALGVNGGEVMHLSRAITALEILVSGDVKTARDWGGLLMIGGKF